MAKNNKSKINWRDEYYIIIDKLEKRCHLIEQMREGINQILDLLGEINGGKDFIIPIEDEIILNLNDVANRLLKLVMKGDEE